MGIRVQPHVLEIPEDDPFKNDLLDRKGTIEILTNLIGSIEGPCAIAIDAAWGNGKSTFLRLWSQFLRNEKFSVVGFNAWETDYSDDPFVTLSTELIEGLNNQSENSIRKKIDNAKNCATEVVRSALPSIIRLGTAGILDLEPLLKGEIDDALTTYAKKRISSYQESKGSLASFRQALQEMADTVSESSNGLPLVVMIDELDRCRPSYAVELLEVAKHIFLVDRVIFVVAINRSQLSHSIKALYGANFDANGYLRRFFDVDFQLPDPERDNFIGSTLTSTGINEFFNRTRDKSSSQNSSFLKDMFAAFFADPELNLRQVSQAIYHFGLVLGSLRSDHRAFMLTAVVALIFRTIDKDLYYKFCRGEISDLEAAEGIFQRPGFGSIRHMHEASLFEAALIIGNHEISRANSVDRIPAESQLLKKKMELMGSESPENFNKFQRSANKVVSLSNTFIREEALDRSIGFMRSVDRIELLSKSLVHDSGSEG